MKTVLYIDSTRGYFGRTLLNGFVEEAKKKSWWDTLILPCRDSVDTHTLDIFQQVDGFVTRDAAPEITELVQKQQKPNLVLRAPSSHEETSAPHVDDDAIGNLVSKEITKLSLPHHAFLGYSSVIWSERRHRAFKETFPSSSKLLLPPGAHSTAAGIMQVSTWLKSLPKPSGLFAASDDLAVAAVQAAKLAGIKVPLELSIIGADNNSPLCDRALITLSSIDLHPETIGRKCAWVMAQQMGLITDLSNAPLLRPPELVIRQSSHCVTKHFVIYKLALSWINKNALRGPSVDELASACSVSRRSLERIFHTEAKTSPANVIREQRINYILHLLTRDEIPLGTIAKQAKFPDQASFSNFVTRNTGKTARSIRLRV